MAITLSSVTYGQNSCSDATEISIEEDGFKMGEIFSQKVDLSNAHKSFGEFFPKGFDLLAIDYKSYWFKFKIPTARSVEIELLQKDSIIPQNSVGMVVYRAGTCFPKSDRLEPRLVTLNKFGKVSTDCLAPGEYLIQICASHKANDSIWLKINLGKTPLEYDNQETAGELGAFNGRKNISIETQCLSLQNQDEINPLLAKDYLKTAWFTFITNDNHQQFSLSTYSIDTAYAVIYEGDIRTNNLKGIIYDTIKLTPKVLKYFDCKLKNSTKYSIALYFKNSANSLFDLQLNNKSGLTAKGSYPPNLSKDEFLGTISKGNNLSDQFIFGCSSKLSNNVCQPANPDSFILVTMNEDIFNGDFISTSKFDLAVWRTFEVKEDCRISINCYSNYSGIRYLPTRIFKGDIKNSCNLELVATASSSNNENLCLPAGKYSIQILGNSIDNSSNKNNIYTEFTSSDIGSSISLQISFVEGTDNLKRKYGNPFQADNQGDITEVLNKGWSAVFEQVNYDSLSSFDTIKIENCNSRIYREFYISEPVSLSARIRSNGSVLFVKDRISNGMDSMTILNNTIDNIWADGNYSFYPIDNYCPLDTGWYSIIACKSRPVVFCNDLAYETDVNSIELMKAQYKCTKPENIVPSKALGFNPLGNNSVSYSANPNIGTQFSHTKSYLAGDCYFCSPDTSSFFSKLKNSCEIVSFDSIANMVFYYFELNKETDFRFSYSGYLRLYRGDFRNDSLGLLNTDNLISKCGAEGSRPYDYYCNIPKGIYIVVNFLPAKSTEYMQITVDKPQKPLFDDIKTAYQFPNLKPGNTYSSPYDVFSCLTGSHKEHKVFDAYDSVYPYPMENNIVQYELYSYRDLWFTFVTDGAGKISFDTDIESERKGIANILIFESNSDPNLPFNQAYQNGEIDTVVGSGLKLIPLIGESYFERGSTCNPDTTRKRYFVRVSLANSSVPFLKKFVSLKLKMEPLGAVQRPKDMGDFCSTAYEFNPNKLGQSTSEQFDITCHSTGEGFGEDGTNLGCLSSVPNLQTTWVKISIPKLTVSGKMDIALSIDKANISSSQISFRLLYGYCGALTPGPCVDYSGSSFRLNCMPSGDYFLQVATTEHSVGSFSVKIEITETENENCKPSSLYEPFANFSFVPPCLDSTIIIENWSSSGDDIFYTWKLSDGTITNQKEPVFNFNPTKELDTLEIKLIVENQKYNSADSITKSIQIRNVFPKVKITNIVDSFCTGKMVFEIEHNVKEAHRIYFTPPPTYYSEDSLKAYYIDYYNNYTFTANIDYGDCTISDSFNYEPLPPKEILKDTLICNNSSVTLFLDSLNKYYNITNWNWANQYAGNSYTIKNAGSFEVYLSEGVCIHYQKFNVNFMYLVDPKTSTDTIFCNKTPVTLKTNEKLPEPNWSTGEKAHQITVNETGKYIAELEYLGCNLTDTFNIRYVNFPNMITFTDTVKCDYDSLLISTDLEADKYLWSNGSEHSYTYISKPGLYNLKTEISQCDTTVSFNVNDFPPTLSLREDTVSCDPIVLILDAGIGQSFNWKPFNENTQQISISDFGEYSVTKINEFGCTEWDSFEMIRECPPVLFIPNVFSPNKDGLNDVFLPYAENLISFKMEIFNRWGEKLYSTTNYEGWDGNWHNEECPQGIYVYVIEYSISENDKTSTGITKGTFHLLR